MGAPGLHSKNGAKYGSWFTVHYIQVYAQHLSSAYHMANEGSAYPAKTFGATNATTSTICGKDLCSGYFWYVSPAAEAPGCLESHGWQHLCHAGPFNGSAFLDCWNQWKNPLEPNALQEVLRHMAEQ